MDLESRKIETANLTMVVPPELSALDLLKGASADKLYFKPEKADPSLDPFMPIPRNVDFSIPLDGSKAKAPSEFISLTPNSSKAGVDGVIETIKDKWNGVFGERDTLHDHVRMLARAGMTPSERQQLAKEEQQIKDYNQANGKSFLGRYDRSEVPKTPMLDELNRRTTALEHNISETAKKGMTPLQIAQLESGTASAALKGQYESRLIATVNQYEHSGTVPKDVYSAVVSAARQQKILDDRQAALDQKEIEKLLGGLPSLPQITIIDGSGKPFWGVADNPIVIGKPVNGEEPFVVGRGTPNLPGRDREPLPIIKPTYKPGFVGIREQGGDGWLGNL